MVDNATVEAKTILTPDQRLRIFVSSTLRELRDERVAASEAIGSLRMTPVMLEAGARPHPPRDLYRSYLEQSHIFIGVYWQSYGWIADDMEISGLEDELHLSSDMPRLIYVKEPAPERDERLTALLKEMSVSGVSYREFRAPDELRTLVANDLALLLTENFDFTPGALAEDPQTLQAITPLPVPASSFVGREGELQSILGLLRDPTARLITLVGPGGIGKTRLALEAAHRSVDEFPDGVVFVPLDTIRDPGFVLQAIAAGLDVRDAEYGVLMESVAERLRRKRILLLLDNFEHVLTGAGAASDLLAAVGDVKILATSRALLELRGEHVVIVGPLEVPAAERLFVDRAEAVSGGFSDSPEDLRAVRDIAQTLDGVPLALELAAARLRALPAPAIAERLRDRLDLLRRGPRDLPERQQTIRNTVLWSYDLLSEEERLLLRRMSVFERGADLAAIEEVCGHDMADPLTTTGALVDKSLLVRVETATGELRVRMLSIIREYASEQLDGTGESEDVKERHALYFLDFAERASVEMWSAEEALWLDLQELDHENVRAAIRWFVDNEKVEEALRLGAALRWFWWIRGHLSRGWSALERILALEGGPASVRGRALVAAGALSIDLGELGRARQLVEEAVRLLEPEGDAVDLAWARSALGGILQSLGRSDEAELLQREALSAFHRGDNPLGQCTASTSLANIEWSRGNYPIAESYYRHSLEARRRLRDPWGTAYVLTALGWTRVLQHDGEEAAEHFNEALPLFRKVRFRDGLANAVNGLGYVAADRERLEETIERFDEALRLYREIGNRPLVALELSRLARAHLRVDQPERALDYTREACELAARIEDRGPWLFAVETLGCLLAAAGFNEDAARLFGAVDGSRDKDKLLADQTLPLARRPFEGRVRDGLGEARAEALWAEGGALDKKHLRVAVRRGLETLAGAMRERGADLR